MLDICWVMLTLRRLTPLKFSLEARPASAASEYSDVLLTGEAAAQYARQNRRGRSDAGQC